MLCFHSSHAAVFFQPIACWFGVLGYLPLIVHCFFKRCCGIHWFQYEFKKHYKMPNLLSSESWGISVRACSVLKPLMFSVWFYLFGDFYFGFIPTLSIYLRPVYWLFTDLLLITSNVGDLTLLAFDHKHNFWLFLCIFPFFVLHCTVRPAEV